jgi:CDGSH-type Zn-finger protein
VLWQRTCCSSHGERRGVSPPLAKILPAPAGGGPEKLAMSEPLEIRCRENGPLVIKGPLRVFDHLGNEFTLPVGKETIALCRCGQSKNKPFCDGSHRACAFQAAEVAKPKDAHSSSG